MSRVDPFLGESAADPMLPVAYRIAETRRETVDTFTLDLRVADGSAPMRFGPGQFNMIYAFGTGESAISISGDPEDGDRIRHTIREVGTVTSALGRLEAGAEVGIRGPFGTGWPMKQAEGKDVIFIAGGIGLAPLRPAIYQVLTSPDRYGKVALLLGARTPGDILYPVELATWQTEVLVTVDRAPEGWKGRVGVVTPLIGKIDFDPGRAIAMICGPEIMMRYAVLELRNRGMRDEDIFITMERNMKCAVGFCGHCQLGPEFICRDGPVFSYDRIDYWFQQREL